MESINIEKYIKDLSPEFQEKARACSNIDELLNLAEENNIPLPDEAVEAVAGGKGKTECHHIRTKRYPTSGKGVKRIGNAVLKFVIEEEVCIDCNMWRNVNILENGTEEYGSWSSLRA